MRRNRLRELLDADQPSLGTHILSSWPSIVELVGLSGMFDYAEFVAEYGPYDLYALDNLGRAVELFDHMSSMMKIEQEPRTYLAVRGARLGHPEPPLLRSQDGRGGGGVRERGAGRGPRIGRPSRRRDAP